MRRRRYNPNVNSTYLGMDSFIFVLLVTIRTKNYELDVELRLISWSNPELQK